MSTWYFLVGPCTWRVRNIYSPTIEPSMGGSGLGLPSESSTPPPQPVSKPQPGELLRVQDMSRCYYSPLPERTLSGETTIGEQPIPRPEPPGTRCPNPGFLPRPAPAEFRCHPREAFLEYQLSNGSTFSGRLPPGLFPNLQPGEVVDIQDRFRRV